MPANKKFQPGEVAILTHDSGGRKLIVHKVTEQGVYERHSIPDQQKYVSPWRLGQVIKVESPEKAAELIGRFEQIEERRQEEVHAAKERAEKAFRKAIGRYEMWEDEA